ncbi:MAG: thiol reductant ABC exporter subunit CydD [Solirubrobacterales bacterium]
MSRQAQRPEARSRARAVQRRLTRTSRAARAHLAATVALGAIATALVIAQATLLAGVVSDAFLGDTPLSDLRGPLLTLLAIALARGLVAAAVEVAGRAGAAGVMSELRSRLARHLLLVRPGTAREEASAELAAAAVQGVDSLEAYFARYLPQAVLAGLAPAMILAWVIPRDWEAGLILAITAPMIPVFMVLIGRLAERHTRDRWEALARLGARFLDTVRGLETLWVNGRAEAQAAAVSSAGERYRRETMSTLRIGFLSALVLELLAMIGTALVAATVGIQLAKGSLGLTAGLTVLILAPELYMPLRAVGAQFHASAEGMAAAERIFEVLDQPPIARFAGGSAPPDPGCEPVRIEGVSLSRPGRGPVLAGADLELHPGETVALVGPSGSGKSTLVAMLLRLAEPDSGRLLCGGEDLRDVDTAAWRRQVAWMPQHPTIFAGTVAENVAFLEPEASPRRILEASERAGLLEVVESLPAGLDTRIGEGGRSLSAGQSRRVGLARALLRDAPLLILDEPTAHLDSGSEARAAAGIEAAAAGRTALFVSHRPEVALRADRVVELRDGLIGEPAGASA